MSRVLVVGQCGLDHGTIASHLRREFKAEVDGASTFAEALASLRASRFSLVLVNRVTDADGSKGFDLIRTIKADDALSSVPVMLVSNYPDAQEHARSLGALPGFGKSELLSASTRQRLGEVLLSPPVEGR